MKKGITVGEIILIIIILIAVICVAIHYTKVEKHKESVADVKVDNYNLENENMKAKMNAVVVKVNENSMVVIEAKKPNELLIVGFSDEGDIGYKQGQEILIYYDGMVLTSYPGQIYNIGKIEIKKEKSDIEIPDKAFRYCYSSRDNVRVEISELTRNSIILNITDTNEFKFVYADNYKISKEVKNPNYTGVGYKIGEDTSNSTAPYVRTRF